MIRFLAFFSSCVLAIPGVVDEQMSGSIITDILEQSSSGGIDLSSMMSRLQKALGADGDGYNGSTSNGGGSFTFGGGNLGAGSGSTTNTTVPVNIGNPNGGTVNGGTGNGGTVNGGTGNGGTGNGGNRNGLSESEFKCLQAHNDARKAYGSASLTWNAALANEAKQYADLSPKRLPRHSGKKGQGENLYWSSVTQNDCANAVAAYMRESKNYNNNRIPEGNFAGYGHYTQVLWKATTEVGCGQSGGTSVCRYTKAGKMRGKTLQNSN
jgi:hypothetical protein